MFLCNSGNNSLYIVNDDYYILDTELIIEIYNNNNQILKTFSTDFVSNIRYINFDFEIVLTKNEEDLINKQIYLSGGFYTLKIMNGNDLYLSNIMFVDIDGNININDIDTSIDIIEID